MRNAAVLLDKAKSRVSPANYSTLAARLDVSRQSVHRWKKGDEPIPEDRVAQIARIAQEDPGEWLVLLHAERSSGDVRRGLVSFLKRVGIAGASLMGIAIMFGVFDSEKTAIFSAIFALPFHAEPLTALCIMRTALFGAAVIALVVWSRRGRFTTALLA